MNLQYKLFKGSILILISALAFGSYGVFSKYLSGYDIFFQTYVRCFIVALVVGAFGLFKGSFRKIDRDDYGWFAVILTFTCFTIAPVLYAFQHLPIGSVSFLFYAALTIFTYIFGFAFFNERVTPVKIICLILAVLGMALVFSVNFAVALALPIGLAILNGVTSSGEITFTKKISQKYSSVQITFMVFLLIAITHFIISLILGEKQDISIVTTSLPILLAFVFAAIVGMLTIVEGYKYVDPSIGAILGLMEIVFSVLFGVLFFNELITPSLLLGGFAIIVAAALPDTVAIIKARTIKSK